MTISGLSFGDFWATVRCPQSDKLFIGVAVPT